MNIKFVLICVLLLTLTACHKPFLEVGGGYARFELEDDIVSVNNVNGQNLETKVDNVDAFIVKVRTGASPIEALPEFRTGIEFRGALGALREWQATPIPSIVPSCFTQWLQPTVQRIG